MNMPQNKLAVFYCGTNGSGKSTLRSFNQDMVQIVIDSDHIAQEINPNDPRSADVAAGRKAVELFQFAVENRISFSMESTLSGKSVLRRIKTAKENGFYVRLNYIAVDKVEINIARVVARVRSGGHFIDEATIRKRYSISAQHLLLALPHCDEAFIYDNSEAQPNLIFWIDQGRIAVMRFRQPEWCQRLQQELHTFSYQTIE